MGNEPGTRVDLDALSHALLTSGAARPGSRLLEVTERPIGIGHTADTLLLSLTWAATEEGPSSVVAKVPSTDETSAATAASIGAYEREVRFYTELAPRTRLSVPACHGVLTFDGQVTGLLLEDLTALSPGEQLVESPLDHVRLARRQLAALQGPFWDDPQMAAADWLHRRLGVPIPGIHERMRRSWAATREALSGDFDDEERALVDLFVESADDWALALSGPYSMTHHDYRVDNLLFGPDHVVVVDWQTVGWGVPMFDLAYLLGTSLSPETRREVERDEVHAHVADLAAHGVAWDLDHAWTAYRQASFAVLLMLVPAAGSVHRTERGDAMFRRLIRQGARMALDLDATQLLPGGTA